jgi:hypothetical protein
MIACPVREKAEQGMQWGWPENHDQYKRRSSYTSAYISKRHKKEYFKWKTYERNL